MLIVIFFSCVFLVCRSVGVNFLVGVANDIIDGVGKVLDVLGVETGHGDASVIGQVDVVLLLQDLDLGGSQACEGEHSNLIDNVVPGTRGTQGQQLLVQSLAHSNNTVGHLGQVLLPLAVQLLVVQDQGYHTGSIGGGVGDDGTLGLGDLRLDSVLDLGGLGDNGQVTCTLRVETKVLGEGLGNEHLKAALNKIADREGVLVERARGETLVSGVEESEVTLALHNVCDLLPLVRGGVDSCGVVGTGVEEEDRARGRSLHGLQHALEVETLGLGVPVGILEDGDSNTLKDGAVVGYIILFFSVGRRVKRKKI